MNDDPFCPAHHRLLVNLTDDLTEAEARTFLMRCFGREKGERAVLVRGCYEWTRQGTSRNGSHGIWITGRGWRAYLRECCWWKKEEGSNDPSSPA